MCCQSERLSLVSGMSASIWHLKSLNYALLISSLWLDTFLCQVGLFYAGVSQLLLTNNWNCNLVT